MKNKIIFEDTFQRFLKTVAPNASKSEQDNLRIVFYSGAYGMLMCELEREEYTLRGVQLMHIMETLPERAKAAGMPQTIYLAKVCKGEETK